VPAVWPMMYWCKS